MKKIKDAYNDIKMSYELEDKILNKTIYYYEKKKKFKISYVVCSSLVLFILSLSIVYAKEIKETVNNVIYKYISKSEKGDLSEYGVNNEATGIHLIKAKDIVYINKFKIDKEILSMSDAEEALDMKFLKLKNFNYKYFSFLYQIENSLNVSGYIPNNVTLVKPEIISINGSNYRNLNCMISFVYNDDNSINKKATKKKREKCLKEQNENQPDKKLAISMYFVTQYASEETVENFVLKQADFPNGQTEIFESKRINGNVYKSRWNEYAFIYENVIYKIINEHNSYSTEEILDMIENMEY